MIRRIVTSVLLALCLSSPVNAEVIFDSSKEDVYGAAFDASEVEGTVAVGWRDGGENSRDEEIRSFLNKFRDEFAEQNLKLLFYYRHDPGFSGEVAGAVSGVPLVWPSELDFTDFIYQLGSEEIRLRSKRNQSKLVLFERSFDGIRSVCESEEECSEHRSGHVFQLHRQEPFAIFRLVLEDIDTLSVQSCSLRDMKHIEKALSTTLGYPKYQALDHNSIDFEDLKVGEESTCTLIKVSIPISGKLSPDQFEAALSGVDLRRDFLLEIHSNAKLAALVSALQNLAEENEEKVSENEAEIERLEKTQSVLEKLRKHSCSNQDSRNPACKEHIDVPYRDSRDVPRDAIQPAFPI